LLYEVMNLRTRFRLPARPGFIFAALLFCTQAFADNVFTSQLVAPRDSYELHYLGSKAGAAPNTTGRIGIFRLIWKADAPTEFLAIVSPDGKTVVPTPDFVVHLAPGFVHQTGIIPLKSGWLYVGRTGIDAPGTQWMPLRPGQAMTFAMPISIVEAGLHWFTNVPDAAGDKARLLINTKAGELTSDDIVLPLVPKTEGR
jgi:hypothetical protein